MRTNGPNMRCGAPLGKSELPDTISAFANASDGSDNLAAIVAADRAFPAAVADRLVTTLHEDASRVSHI